MILIVGLGNPGEEYRETRHNIGFEVIDALASVTDSGNKYKKFNSTVIDSVYSGINLLLLKPLTFMNNSGCAVDLALKFYGAGIKRIIVIHDDIDLEFGRIKIKRGGGTAGHRGLKSIFTETGRQDYERIRFGVGRPPGRMDASDYVLRKFKKNERKELGIFIDHSVDMLKYYITDGFESAAGKYN
jgi:peptidyl-tRNA hydrolase, PTH1 family